MMNNAYMIFKAAAENEAFIRVAVSGFLLYLDPSLEDINDIKTAVSEAVTNVIIHAYKNSEGNVYFSISEENRDITIIVKDEGRGIENIEKAKQPFFSDDLISERAGLGFTVMESFMDSLEIKSQVGIGTEIIMTKRLH